MAEKPVYWDRHSEADRLQFAKFLDPLVIASRTKNFTKAEATVYLLTLQDVPREILALAVTRLIEQGITWMPKPGDIKHACADVVDERRKHAARVGQALIDECSSCNPKGWVTVQVNGVERVQRCACWTRRQQLIAEAGEPLKRPALPVSTEPEPAA